MVGEMIYENNSYKLFTDSFVEGKKKAYALNRNILVNKEGERVSPVIKNDVPEVITECPLIDVLYKIAVQDHEMLIVDNQYFRACTSSRPVGRIVFTRDIAYSSFLGTSLILPGMVKNHLQYTRKLRREVGYKCSKSNVIPIPGFPNKVECEKERDFWPKYKTNSYGRRTDDIVWIIGFWEYFCVTQDYSSLKWMIDEFDYFDKKFYQYFYDPNDNLYWGQASFIDAGGTGYPNYSPQESIMIKALSTNCLYAGAFDRLERACRLIGLDDKADEFKERSQTIRDAIRKNFLHKDGYYAYFKRKDGSLEPRREQVGSALLVLFDILPPKEQNKAVDDYPYSDFGAPLFWPFYPNNRCYHNNSIWPFADTLFALALFKCYRRKDILLRALANLCRHSLRGNFNEVLHYPSGEFRGADHYIWSAAAYLAVLFKMIGGISIDESKVRFNPYLPAELGSSFTIKNLRIGKMKLDINIRGNGGDIVDFKVDGKKTEDFTIYKNGRSHTVEIHLQE